MHTASDTATVDRGGRPPQRHRAITVLVVALTTMFVASACEAVTFDRVNATRATAELDELTLSEHLRDRARARAAAMCAAGEATLSSDVPEDYLGEPTTALDELVGAAPLDMDDPDRGRRNGRAGNLLWDAWRHEPTLVDPHWDSMGVGEHECDDGMLYSAVVLRDDPPALDEPADISQIVPAETVTSQGWTFQRYRNLAAPCAISGYQSFLLGAPTGSDPEAPGPLYVRMRGGGVGWFDVDGAPRPGPHNKSEESLNTQLGYVDGGVLRRTLEVVPGMRVLVVSMCSHDIYAGNQTFDPYNPNLTADGRTRPTSGLTATKAAVQFALDTYATDQYILHGTSAGGYGVYHVGWALQRQGIPPTALISDSGVLNQAWLTYVAETGISGSSGCEKNTEERGFGVLGRTDAEILDPANQPHLLVADGRLEIPTMHVWSAGDHALCGAVPIPCPLPDGSTPTLWAADCQHEPMRLAIAGLDPDHPSTYLRLCVEGNRPTPCDHHVPTRGDRVNTDPGAPADYNGAIVDWLLDRLADDPT
ncbi:MAG: hypothetical protein JJU45_17220 [Acidimicrobiia bacterium]|nr:hypothetical protein [Acidimicrobiia bacterium]